MTEYHGKAGIHVKTLCVSIKNLKTLLFFLCTGVLVIMGLFIAPRYDHWYDLGGFRVVSMSQPTETVTKPRLTSSAIPAIRGRRRGIEVPDKGSPFYKPDKLDLDDMKGIYSSALWPEGCAVEKTVTWPNCTQPRKNVVLVKTHKCGSSTLSALVLRYAARNGLSIALPKPDPSHVGWPKPYRPAYVQNYHETKPFNVIANHLVYDRCYIQNDFPRDKTIYTTILREPWSQFVSTVNYFHFPQFPPPKKPLKHILEQPEIWARPLPMGEPPDPTATRSLVQNMMANDLGFHNDQAENQTSIDLFIRRLDKDFDLVMILEFFHESMVLLKRLLCWELSDMFYIKLNPKRSTRADSEYITPSMITSHRKLDDVDYQIYNHFFRKIRVKIREQDSTFKQEVEAFDSAIDQISEYCNTDNPGSKSSPLYMKANKFMKAQVVTIANCTAWKVEPRPFTQDLKQKLRKKLFPNEAAEDDDNMVN